MTLTSAPVVPCSCAEGWKPEGWAHCADCYEGQIERLRDIARRVSDLPYFKNKPIEDLVRDARAALAIPPASQGDAAS